jgi:ABC-type proline/glycine betaine transport system permease subunit
VKRETDRRRSGGSRLDDDEALVGEEHLAFQLESERAGPEIYTQMHDAEESHLAMLGQLTQRTLGLELRSIGFLPALIALTLYALLPIVRNTHTAMTQISRGMKQAALSLGMTAGTILQKIELPLAAPTILAGIKTSAVINVGTATIAAFIGAGGYGERIVTGLALNDHAMLLAGAVPAAVLALLIEGAFRLGERWMIPAGLRRAS